MFKYLLVLVALFAVAFAASERDEMLFALNSTTGGPYTYQIRNHRFFGTAYDGSYLDTKNACAGYNNSCRNNPDCKCKKNEGPLPPGTYQIGTMFKYKGYENSYQLYPQGDTCGRSDFLIHGGNCGSGNPSIGCIVIESASERYMIKSNSILYVVE